MCAATRHAGAKPCSPRLHRDELKRCTKCGQEKPPAEFSRDRSRKDGRAPWCKACVRRWHQENAEHLADYHRRWQRTNPEKKRAQQRRYRERKRDDPEDRERRRANARRRDRERRAQDPDYRERRRANNRVAIGSESEADSPTRLPRQATARRRRSLDANLDVWHAATERPRRMSALRRTCRNTESR
jgi:hypothetical protein